jgi:hypothetical protein
VRQVRLLQIETAYDALLMRSMKARLSGELQPARDVRYADVRKFRPAKPRVPSFTTPWGVTVVRDTSFLRGPNEDLHHEYIFRRREASRREAEILTRN